MNRLFSFLLCGILIPLLTLELKAQSLSNLEHAKTKKLQQAAPMPNPLIEKSAAAPVLTADFFSMTEQGHQCNGGIAMRLKLSDPAVSPDFWERVFKYLFTEKRLRRVEKIDGQTVELFRYVNDRPDETANVFTSSNGNPRQKLSLRSLVTISDPEGARDAGRLLLCLDPATQPPSSFSIEVKFVKDTPSQPRPDALATAFNAGGLSGNESPSLKDIAALPGEVGQRALDKNLDLGISFTSSRDTTKDPVTMQNKTQRNNRGVLDVRLIPFLNVARTQVPPFNQQWFPFWTPIYIDANIATGKITTDTLSLNRVEFGSVVEYRLIPFKKRIVEGRQQTDTGRYTTFYRLMFAGKHASDRDFKQKEVAASAEFQPMFAALNHPLESSWKRVADPITGNGVFQYGRFGWEFKPKFGFDFGRTYSRDDPAAAIKASPNIRRFYSQMDAAFDITSHLKLSVTDTFYVRGEFAENRKKNYFKAELLIPLNIAFGNATHAMFVNYENGNKPPFNKPDVSAFRIGYRIRANGWFGQRR